MSATGYFILFLSGRKISKEGPYLTSDERRSEAQDMWRKVCNQYTENLFWLDAHSDGRIEVGSFDNLNEDLRIGFKNESCDRKNYI